MRTKLFVTSLLLASQASASWFSSSEQPAWKDWDQAQLQAWLEEHNVHVPKGYSQEQLSALVQANWYSGQAWTEKQVENAKELYDGYRQSAIDSWSDTQLKDFLIKQGVVAPSGPREQLVLAANKQYRAYTSAASSLSAAASTAYCGDKKYQATKTAENFASTASSAASSASAAVKSVINDNVDYASVKLDDTKDYIYSTWDDNQLRTYLEEKGVIKTKQQATRDELLAKMKDNYAAVADPVWKAWSDSYLWHWLHARGLVQTPYEKKRSELESLANQYYYSTTDTVYSSWSDSQLKAWLVEHNIVKSDAQLKKEKMQRLVADNYASAHDTVYSGWRDSDLREWLVEHGYLRSDAQVKRDELIKLMNDKYTDASSRTAAYLTWPDARLRAYLRAHGVDDAYLPGSRPGLLQEVRIRWVQTNNNVESLLQRIRDLLSNGVEYAEEQLHRVVELLTGTAHSYSDAAYEKKKQANAWKDEKVKQGGEWKDEKVKQGGEWKNEKVKEAADKASAAGKSASSLASKASKSASSASKSASKSEL